MLCCVVLCYRMVLNGLDGDGDGDGDLIVCEYV